MSKSQSGASGDQAVAGATSEFETLPGLLRVLRRRWKTVCAFALVIAVLGLAAIALMTPKYAATAILEVEQEQRPDGSATAESTASTADALKSESQTDIAILQSDGLALQVIEQLGLENKAPFKSARVAAEKGRPIEEAPRTRERLIKLFQHNLKVSSAEDTRLINVTVQNPDAALAATMANTLCDLFVNSTMEHHRRTTTQLSYSLQQELADLKAKVEISEQKLADYESKTGMAGVQLAGGSTGDGTSNVSISPQNTVTERLFALNQELTSAEANRISAQMMYHLVQSQDPEVVLGLGSMSVSNPNGSGSGAITADGGIDLVRSLRAQQASLARQYAAASVTYGVNSARLVQLKQQVDAVDQQMQAELQRIRTRALNAYWYAKQNEDKIREEFSHQQGAANRMADSTVQLQILAQEAYSNRALYENLFSKLQTATLASGVHAARIDVIERARAAGMPSSPDYLKFAALVLAVALFFGVSAAFLRESMDETVRTPRHLSEAPGLALLGYVPGLMGAKMLGAEAGASRLMQEPTSPFSESFRALRTAVLLSLPASTRRSLLITSAMGGEGKTTVVYNLGVAFAQQGARVLLIDGDLRHPELHRHFGCAVTPGLSEFLRDTADGQPAVMRHGSLPGLYMLPAGQQPELPTELFGLESFAALLKQCESRYDYVLIDSPPILPVADATVIGSRVGGVLAVVRSGMTTRSLLAALVRTLGQLQTPTVGVVLNDVRQPTLHELPAYSYSRTNREGALHGMA